MRVAVGGLHTECSTYNPVLMSEGDFTIWRGAEMLEKTYFDVLKRHDATYLPTFYARAVPGGPVSLKTYQDFKTAYLASARGGAAARRRLSGHAWRGLCRGHGGRRSRLAESDAGCWSDRTA